MNTTGEAVEIEEPVLRLTEVEPGTPLGPLGNDSAGRDLDRPGEVLKRPRLEHLNEKERKEIEKTCLDCRDILYLAGEVLSSTTAVKHQIRLQPGTEPVNARPYRLPESQKQEVRGQIEELKSGGVITESNSAWNSPLLVVPKQSDASGDKRWRLVIDYDYRKLNEKTVGDAYRYRTSLKF